MISVRRKTDGYRLRLHRMTIDAEARVVQALARYVVHNDRRASTLAGRVHRSEPAHHPRAVMRRPRLTSSMRTAGRHHDLQAIYDRLERLRRFGGAPSRRGSPGAPARARAGDGARSRWAASPSRIVSSASTRRFDQDNVPDFFVGVDRLPRDAAREARGHAHAWPPALSRPGSSWPRRRPLPRLRARHRLGESKPRSLATFGRNDSRRRWG